MITGRNESKTLTKHIVCECKSKFDGTKCNSDQWWHNDKCRCECKKHHICEIYYFWNPSTCSCENGKYLASIMDHLTINCDEVIESYDEKINFNEKQAICKTQNFYNLLAFLLITIALLKTVRINCYLIKYKVKNLLSFHNINNKLNKFCIDSIN